MLVFQGMLTSSVVPVTWLVPVSIRQELSCQMYQRYVFAQTVTSKNIKLACERLGLKYVCVCVCFVLFCPRSSVDGGLGLPFNIASYSLLTCMIAHICGLKPGEFIHVGGDTHVYLNHTEPLQEQLKRTPRAFPILRIKRDVPDIDSFTFHDFELTEYHPFETIKMKMAV